ncbi:MAG: hypothetical protein ACJ8GN_27310 [Longimicrobiaceae bacterium]
MLTKAGRGIVPRTDRLIRVLMVGAVVEVAAFVASVISAGGGHGTYVIITLCFPYSMALTYFTEYVTTPLLLLIIFQFPTYALLGWLLEPIKPRGAGWSVLAVIHVLAVAMAFVLADSAFTP